MNKYNRLQQFRFDTHQMLVKSKDAAFQLMDSIMATENARSLAEFSLYPFSIAHCLFPIPFHHLNIQLILPTYLVKFMTDSVNGRCTEFKISSIFVLLKYFFDRTFCHTKNFG